MNDSVIRLTSLRYRAKLCDLLTAVARRFVRARFRTLNGGLIRLEDGSTTETYGRAMSDDDPHAVVTIHDSRFYRELVSGGELGAAEAFIQGWWSCDDLTALFRIFARDLDATDALSRGFAKPTAAIARMLHRLRDNTRRNSVRNIRAHYDLGNDFFEQFLDASMTYSCAYFERPDQTLGDAQRAKLDRVCRKLALSSDDHLLEIGTGWGSFAIHAARTYGCRVTTTTISAAQFESAVRRVHDAGLSDRIEILRCDYRDLAGHFDKIVSLEMIEAVGEAHLDTYFRACARLFTPGGQMLLQAIVMADQCYDRYRRSVDFIQRYVFPGGFLPSVGAIAKSAGRATDLRIVDSEDLTRHYVTTLRCWRARFLARLDKIRRLGYPETLLRMWDYYLSYCEAGFAESRVGVVQLILTR
jgi:cyclopropane-fatty-acyl-phospholipid synthase